ncbi:MAG: glycosyltransferase family 39 protein, partial [Armatimonadota bacterium]|nr:glycosyltransferase family 39 protein [Armatimonadota bacterium]
MLLLGALYYRIVNYSFVFDDAQYIQTNEYVQKGLTAQTIKWCFTAFYAANWHPLTWLSHALDCQLFGLNAGSHHIQNLLLHILNSLLLFVLLLRMTNSVWKSGFVAVLFGVHPLHVESVAWISERKDVLSTFFWMLSILAYIRYAQSPGFKTYVPLFIFFALGLMSKPMLVTLPFVLILLDYWPLRRWNFNQDLSVSVFSSKIKSLVLEKIPLFTLSAISSIVTYLAQEAGGTTRVMKSLPFG